jgi:hypothetical protein
VSIVSLVPLTRRQKEGSAMTLPTRVAVHLTVVSAALLTAALHPGHPSVAPGRAATHPALVTTSQVTAVATTVALTSRAAIGRHPLAHRRNPAVAPTTLPQPALTRPHAHRTTPARPTSRHRAAPPTGPTGWAALDAAIARIPTYRPGIARWVVSRRYGHWGTADWYHATLYISPTVPTAYLYDVAVHEWSHELSVLDYGGDVDATVKATNRVFGGSNLVGAERAADCMALLQGATWTHYTNCADASWRAAAARLVRGDRL